MQQESRFGEQTQHLRYLKTQPTAVNTLASSVARKHFSQTCFKASRWPLSSWKFVNQLVAAAAADRYSEVLLKSKNDTSEIAGHGSQSEAW